MSFAALLQESKRDHESWRYTSLPIMKAAFAAAREGAVFSLPAPLALARLVFVGGQYRADLSQKDGLPEEFVTQEKDGALRLRVQAQTCLVLRFGAFVHRLRRKQRTSNSRSARTVA
jgi:hypothetical protein